MKKPSAMFLAGLFSTLFIIGSVFMAFQAGVFASATTTVQVNGDINVPEMKDKPADSSVPEVVFVTRTQFITQSPIVQTVYVTVTEENHQREAELLQQLNEAYRLLRERDAAYQAKLKEAYDRAQASAAKVPGNTTTTNQVVVDRAGSGVSSSQNTDLPAGSGQTGSGQTGSGQTNTGHTGGTQTGSTLTATTTSTLHLVPAKPVTGTHDSDLGQQDFYISGSYTSTVNSLQNIHDLLLRYTNTQQTVAGQFVNPDYLTIGFPLNRTAGPTDTAAISGTITITAGNLANNTGTQAENSSPTPAAAAATSTATSVDINKANKENNAQHKTNTRTGTDNSQKTSGTVQNSTTSSVGTQQITSTSQNNTSDRKDSDSTQSQQSSQQNNDKKDDGGQRDKGHQQRDRNQKREP